MIKKCKVCKNLIKVPPSLISRKKYCSKKCLYLGRPKRKRIWVDCKCKECKKRFKGIPSEVKRGKSAYCSRKCYFVWRKKQRKITCSGCDTLFERNNIKRKYCSYKCWLSWNRRTRIARLKGTRYQLNRGYVDIVNDEGKTMPEHKYIWEKYKGKIPKGWLIHHLNGIRDDNRIENLQALPRKFHNAIKIIEPYQERIRELEEKLLK